MKKNNEILDDIGKFIVHEIYDSPFKMMEFYLRDGLKIHSQNEIFIHFFKSLTLEQRESFIHINKDLMSNILFQFFTY